jgi:hypothetical protein
MPLAKIIRISRRPYRLGIESKPAFREAFHRRRCLDQRRLKALLAKYSAAAAIQ